MKDIEELILKSIYGTLTSSEQEVLNVWLADGGNKKHYIRVRQRLLQRDAVQFLAEVDTEKALRLSHRRRHHRLDLRRHCQLRDRRAPLPLRPALRKVRHHGGRSEMVCGAHLFGL